MFAAIAEPLETRLVLSVLPLNPPGAFITQPFNPFPSPRAVLGKSKTLEIFATFNDDKIKITVGQMNGANRIHIAVGERERTVLYRDVQQITIIADFGNDLIQFDDPQGLLASRRTQLFGDSTDQMDVQTFGNDTIRGSAGRDRIRGGEGNDSITAGGGADNVDPNGGNDTVFGNAGNDFIEDRDGTQSGTMNYFDGGPGNDSINGSDFSDTILGQEGNDSLNAAFGDDSIQGGPGDDSLTGFAGTDTIFGEDGNDEIYGDRKTANQDATPPGDNGNDKLYGGDGNDSIWGEAGDDQIFGQEGSDTLLGQFGSDRLDGGEGNDYLNGHEGEDRVVGGLGRDLFNLIDFQNPEGQTDFSTRKDNPNPRPRQGSVGGETALIDVLA